jgi:hypothetical protein
LSKIAHSTVMDVLYYLTPQHCQEVVDSVVNTLNRVHARFRVRHPQFTGQVSVLGHSFGSVLLWDILCHQPSRRLPAAADDARRCAKAGADGTEQPAQASEDPAGQRQGDVHQSPQMQRRAAACFDGENAKERTERQQPTSTCTDTDTDAPRPGASLEHTADTTSHTPSAISSYPLPPTNAAVAAATAAAVVDSRRSVDGERKESAAERENKFLRAEVARLHQELAEAEGRLSAAETPVPNTWQQNTINYGELAFEVDLFVLIGTHMASAALCFVAEPQTIACSGDSTTALLRRWLTLRADSKADARPRALRGDCSRYVGIQPRCCASALTSTPSLEYLFARLPHGRLHASARRPHVGRRQVVSVPQRTPHDQLLSSLRPRRVSVRPSQRIRQPSPISPAECSVRPSPRLPFDPHSLITLLQGKLRRQVCSSAR